MDSNVAYSLHISLMNSRRLSGESSPGVGQKALERIRLQIIVGLILAITYVLSFMGVLPSHQVIYALIDDLFSRYGTVIIVPISFIENLVGLNAYFPGSVAILTAMGLTSGNPGRAVMTFLAIVLPSFLAHQINYAIGRKIGKRRDFIDEGKENRYSSFAAINLVFMGAMWHPHFASLSCIDAGSQGLQYKKFLPVFSFWFFLWNFFWGFTMYSFGTVLSRESVGLPMLVGFLLAWSIWDLFNLGQRLKVTAKGLVAGLGRNSSSGSVDNK